MSKDTKKIPRKITKIELGDCYLYALADDGTLWRQNYHTISAESKWTQIPPLPDEEFNCEIPQVHS